MNEREVMQQALDALEAGDWYINQLELLVYSVDDEGVHENRAKVQEAITSMRVALAQPAQEPMVCRFCHDERGEWVWQCNHCGEIDDSREPSPPQRQPLTSVRVKELLTRAGYDDAAMQSRADFICGLRYGEGEHGITGDTK